MRRYFKIALIVVFTSPTALFSQVNEAQVGAWYTYFFQTENTTNNWGIQGDVQYRNWNAVGDLEQLLLRAGATYKTNFSNLKFTVGFAEVFTGAYGVADDLYEESRIYQEALLPHFLLGKRIHFVHRMRSEQRWVEDEFFKTRYRYNIIANVPLNGNYLKKGSIYLSLQNEIFLTSHENMFDRNRAYAGFGYSLTDKFRFQGGYMHQSTNQWEKGQVQFSLHHTIQL
jgi:hypothetical protein